MKTDCGTVNMTYGKEDRYWLFVAAAFTPSTLIQRKIYCNLASSHCIFFKWMLHTPTIPIRYSLQWRTKSLPRNWNFLGIFFVFALSGSSGHVIQDRTSFRERFLLNWTVLWFLGLLGSLSQIWTCDVDFQCCIYKGYTRIPSANFHSWWATRWKQPRSFISVAPSFHKYCAIEKVATCVILIYRATAFRKCIICMGGFNYLSA